MNDFIVPSDMKPPSISAPTSTRILDVPKSDVPNYDTLKGQLAEASLLVEDIVLKNYLTRLTELEIVPLDDSLKRIGDIRLFKMELSNSV